MNNNITEDYCSFKVSKLLYKKGARFSCPDGRIFSWNGHEVLCQVESPRWKNLYAGSTTPDIVQPTHALAVKWIRENFGIYIIFPIGFGYPVWWCYHVYKVDNSDFFYDSEESYNSPEEATEAALLYTLQNLIS